MISFKLETMDIYSEQMSYYGTVANIRGFFL